MFGPESSDCKFIVYSGGHWQPMELMQRSLDRSRQSDDLCSTTGTPYCVAIDNTLKKKILRKKFI